MSFILQVEHNTKSKLKILQKCISAKTKSYKLAGLHMILDNLIAAPISSLK